MLSIWLSSAICIDEAQSESIKNSWGTAVQRLVNAGALALLVTATPVRSDDTPLVGFPCDEIDSQEELYEVYRRTDDPMIKEWLLYASTKRTWKLLPHHETTLRDAWAENAIAQVERFPYDMHSTELTNTNLSMEVMLSEIPGSRVIDYLGAIVREASVRREGVKIFAEALAILKQTIPEVAGMIFVANDHDTDKVANVQAIAVKKLLEEYHPGWEIYIATSNDSKAARHLITNFGNEVKPQGDVPIVKQMAACGIDPPRCKVILDLSPVRAPVGWTQRIMRINRLYKGLKGLYICPDDVLSRTLFLTTVRLESGHQSRPIMTYTNCLRKNYCQSR